MKYNVTLGVCVRNGEYFIKNAIESAINQDYPNELMEIIFVDDGSTDNTLRIIKDYILKINMNTKLYITDKRGTGPSRNLIMKNAESKYLIWLDSDMILTKNFVKKMVKYMEKNGNVGIAKGKLGIIDNKNYILNLELIPYIIRTHNKKCFKKIDHTMLPGTGGSIFRLAALKQIKGFDENIIGAGEDQDAARRIIEAGWCIRWVDVIFYETHGHMSTWKDLWKRYFWQGFTSYDLYRQKKHPFMLYRMTPIAGLIYGFLIFVSTYKILRQKISLLIPFHFCFKTFAWCLGFVKNQFKFLFRRDLARATFERQEIQCARVAKHINSEMHFRRAARARKIPNS